MRAFLLKFVVVTLLLLLLWPWLAPGYARMLAAAVLVLLRLGGITGSISEATADGFVLQASRGIAPGRSIPLDHLGAITANWIPYAGLLLAGPIRRSALKALAGGTGIIILSHVLMAWLLSLMTILTGSEGSGPLRLLLVAGSLSVLWPFLLWFASEPGQEVLGLSRRPPKQSTRPGDKRN